MAMTAEELREALIQRLVDKGLGEGFAVSPGSSLLAAALVGYQAGIGDLEAEACSESAHRAWKRLDAIAEAAEKLP